MDSYKNKAMYKFNNNCSVKVKSLSYYGSYNTISDTFS